MHPSRFAVGNVIVVTTDNGGLPAEHYASRLTDRLIAISADAHPAIREQAQAFRSRICEAAQVHIEQAIRSDRLTVAAKLRKAGLNQIADQILRSDF